MSRLSRLQSGAGREALKRVILRDNPHGYWPCDDAIGSSQVTDESGNGYHLTTLTGITFESANLLPVAEDVRYMRLASGSASGAMHSGTLGLTMPLTGVWSAEFIIMPVQAGSTSYDNLMTLSAVGETAATNVQMAIHAQNQWVRAIWEYGSGTDQLAASPGEPNFYQGSPTHVGITKHASGTGVFFYINGRNIGRALATYTEPSGGGDCVFTLGNRSDATALFSSWVMGHAAFYPGTELVQTDYRKRAIAAGLWGVNC